MAERNQALVMRRRFRELLPLAFLTKPLRLFCKHCDKLIPVDMDWTCGHCDKQHAKPKTYSFLNRCEGCKRAPKAVDCPQCGQPNCFNNDGDMSHSAKPIHAKSPEPVKEDPREKLRAARAFEKEDLLHEKEVAELRANIEIVKGKPAGSKRAKDIEERARAFAEIAELIERLSKEFEAKYKDNPEQLENSRVYIQMLREEQSLE